MFSAEDNDKTCPYYMAMPPTPTHRITRCWHLRRAVRSSSSGPWAPKAQSSQGLPGLAFAVCLEVDFISLFEPVIFSQAFMRLCVCVCLVAQSCLTLCNPMDCSPSGSSVHGISQARILDWGVWGSSPLRDRTQVSLSLCVPFFHFSAFPYSVSCPVLVYVLLSEKW